MILTESFQVICLMDRHWNPSTKEFNGNEQTGTLIEIGMQSSEDDPGKLIPVGIVLMNDNTFQRVPIEFIRKI